MSSVLAPAARRHPMGLRRFFTCYSSPMEFSPNCEHPLPDEGSSRSWTKERQQQLQRQLTNSYTPYNVPRDTAYLVNVMCDRQLQLMGYAAAASRPQSPPGAASFRRLSSGAYRAGSAPLPAAHAGTVPYIPAAADWPAGLIQHTPAPQRAPAAGQLPHNYHMWTQSRKQLETNLAVEQAVTQLQLGPDYYLSEHTRLQQRLARLNLVAQVAVGDGNCQFRSVSEQLYGRQDYHAFVRQRAVEHIRRHPEEYESFLGEDFYQYTAGMAQHGTWGDELTLRAICDSFGVAVHVVTSEQHNWYLRYQPLALKSSLEVFLTYVAPIHYNSLRRQKTLGRSCALALPSFNKRHMSC